MGLFNYSFFFSPEARQVCVLFVEVEPGCRLLDQHLQAAVVRTMADTGCQDWCPVIRLKNVLNWGVFFCEGTDYLLRYLVSAHPPAEYK